MRRPGDIAACYADASKAKAELGWEAKNGVKERVLHKCPQAVLTNTACGTYCFLLYFTHNYIL